MNRNGRMKLRNRQESESISTRSITTTSTPTSSLSLYSILLVLIFSLSTTISVVKAQSEHPVDIPRGVSPKDAHLFKPQPSSPNHFKCLDSQELIPIKAINDDYCDCKDGSDEPGTSACSDRINLNGTGNGPKGFWCENKGHLQSWILNSRVNDGICDPDCCDGSDEYLSPNLCPNKCAEVGKQYRKTQTELLNKRRSGSKIRKDYINQALRNSSSGEKEVDRLEIEIGVVKINEERLRKALEKAEEREKKRRDWVEASSFHGELTKYQKSLSHQSRLIQQLNSELTTLTSLLDDLSKGYNPNYQDMAVKGAVVDYRNWRKTVSSISSGDETEKESSTEGLSIKEEIDLPNKKLESLEKEIQSGAFGSNEIRELERKNLLDWILESDLFSSGSMNGLEGGNGPRGPRKGSKSSDHSGILFRIHEYLPDQIVPYFEAFIDTLLDLLLKANVITEFKRRSPINEEVSIDEDDEDTSVAQARETLSETTKKLSNLQSQLDQALRASNNQPEKYGKDSEFKSLENTCLKRDMGEYTYEFCFFGSAKQIPNKSGPTVSLGSFQKFPLLDEVRGDVKVAEYGNWERMLYDKGQKCWNGPERSTIVDLVCDTTNALLDVFEAEKCIYSMKVSTPSVCWPLVEELKEEEVGGSGAIPHEEL